jgi:short-subunit dehydrogenase
MSRQVYTLITGGSSGLGREFAIQCAEKGMNLILTALPGSRTQSLADQLMQKYQVAVEVFEFDVINHLLLIEKITYIAEHFNINFLINNAGIGGTIPILESSLTAIDRIVQVNIRSMVLTTQILLPKLISHRKSYIMNISSMAAFTPIAYKSVYPASKAFISSFSLGLREEVHGSGLSVSAVYPGPIMTNSGVSARIIGQGLKGRIGLLSSSEIAKIALKKTLIGKAVIIPGAWNQLNHRLMSFLPMELKLRIVSSTIKKEITMIYP